MLIDIEKELIENNNSVMKRLEGPRADSRVKQ